MLRFILMGMCFLLINTCSDDDNNSRRSSSKKKNPPPSESNPVFNLKANMFRSYLNTVNIVFENVKVGDKVHLYRNSICSGTRDADRTIVAGEIPDGILTIDVPFNADIVGEHHFSGRIVRSGKSSPCITRTVQHRTVMVAGGGHHACAILSNGLLKCWGESASGQLGLDSYANRGDGASEDGRALHPVLIGSDRNMEVLKVALGGEHSCSIMSDRRLRCWGKNAKGQLGLEKIGSVGGVSGDMQALVAIDLGSSGGEPLPVWDVSVGNRHTCALVGERASNVSAKCWGDNASGSLGYESGAEDGIGDEAGEMGSALAAVNLGTGLVPQYIGSGDGFNCALFGDGSVKCWGKNSYGQLGLGDTTDRGGNSGEMGDALPKVDLGENRTAVSIAVGDNHVCATLSDQKLVCWGDNVSGELGLGDNGSSKGVIGDQSDEMGDNLVAADMGSGRRAIAVSAGDGHTCAVLDNKAVKCWGSNTSGELGLGDNDNRGENAGEMGDSLPAVDLGGDALMVSAGMGNYTCALLADDSVKCWGLGDVGQLLHGATSNLTAPPASGLDLADDNSPVKDLSMGEEHACAVLTRGQVKCWGKNNYGQLGQGKTTSIGHATAGTLDELDEIEAVDLGRGVTATMVAVGTKHSCAAVKDIRGEPAGVKCWGRHDTGQLGYGNIREGSVGDEAGEMGENLEFLQFGAASVVDIQAGEDFTCVLLSDDSVRCWGKNNGGQLGRGDTNTIGNDELVSVSTTEAVSLPTGRSAKVLSVGAEHACVIMDNDTLLCWGGDTRGQLGQASSDAKGNNEEISALSPIDFGTTDTVIGVSAGADHTCAILTGGAAVCWGENASGQLGRDNTTDVAGGDLSTGNIDFHSSSADTLTKVAAAGGHSCGVFGADGTVICWGLNDSGQLGTQSTTEVGDDATRDVAGTGVFLDLGRVVQLEAGGNQSCAVNRGLLVQCWGENDEGQLGYGDTNARGDGNGESPAANKDDTLVF